MKRCTSGLGMHFYMQKHGGRQRKNQKNEKKKRIQKKRRNQKENKGSQKEIMETKGLFLIPYRIRLIILSVVLTPLSTHRTSIEYLSKPIEHLSKPQSSIYRTVYLTSTEQIDRIHTASHASVQCTAQFRNVRFAGLGSHGSTLTRK